MTKAESLSRHGDSRNIDLIQKVEGQKATSKNIRGREKILPSSLTGALSGTDDILKLSSNKLVSSLQGWNSAVDHSIFAFSLQLRLLAMWHKYPLPRSVGTEMFSQEPFDILVLSNQPWFVWRTMMSSDSRRDCKSSFSREMLYTFSQCDILQCLKVGIGRILENTQGQMSAEGRVMVMHSATGWNLEGRLTSRCHNTLRFGSQEDPSAGPQLT